MKWFICWSPTDTQESDAEEVAATFDFGDLLNDYPYPVRTNSRQEATEIAAEWHALGPDDDVGNLSIDRGSRTCWLVRL